MFLELVLTECAREKSAVIFSLLEVQKESGAYRASATSILAEALRTTSPGVTVTGCGTTALSYTPNDVRICDGQMFETVNDGGGVANLDAYPKQPFDFTDRTGKVTFDLSADADEI